MKIEQDMQNIYLSISQNLIKAWAFLYITQLACSGIMIFTEFISSPTQFMKTVDARWSSKKNKNFRFDIKFVYLKLLSLDVIQQFLLIFHPILQTSLQATEW